MNPKFKFWVTTQDRQVQQQILQNLLTINTLLSSNPKLPNKTQRPKVLTEEQLDDIAEAAAYTNGKNIQYEAD